MQRDQPRSRGEGLCTQRARAASHGRLCCVLCSALHTTATTTASSPKARPTCSTTPPAKSPAAANSPSTRRRKFAAKASNALAAAHQDGCGGEGEDGKALRRPLRFAYQTENFSPKSPRTRSSHRSLATSLACWMSPSPPQRRNCSGHLPAAAYSQRKQRKRCQGTSRSLTVRRPASENPGV